MDLLYSRQALPYLHFVEAAQFPFGNQDPPLQPIQQPPSLPLEPKVADGSLNFRFNEVTNAASSRGSIPCLGTKTCRLAGHGVLLAAGIILETGMCPHLGMRGREKQRNSLFPLSISRRKQKQSSLPHISHHQHSHLSYQCPYHCAFSLDTKGARPTLVF